MFWWLDMIHQNHFIIIILYYICLFFYIHYHQDQCCHKLRKSSKHAWRLHEKDFLVQRASNWTDIPQIGEGISSIPFQIGWYSRRYILWSEVSHSKWVLGAGWLLPLGGFSAVHSVRSLVTTVSAADLLPSGRLFLMLKATFQCLPFNIAVENSFARMKNTQKTCRGRNDVTDTLCAKHVLAEIKHAHLVGLKSFEPTTVEPAMGHVEPMNAPIAQAHDDQNQDQSASTVSTRRRVFNGYSLFWKTAMDARLPLPGETDNQCRLRVREECTRNWNDQSEEGVNLRKLWGDKARHLNRSFKCNQSIVPAVMPSTQDASSLLEQLIESDKSKIQQLVPLPVPAGNKAHIGPCGLGDEFWAMREDLVANADVNPGFVKQFSNDWKQRAGGMVATNDQLPNRTVHLSCQQLYGFCVKQIKHVTDFNHVLKQLKQFVSNHRRLHVSGGKNKGPNLDHQCPLLVLKSVFATDDVSTSSSSTRFIDCLRL